MAKIRQFWLVAPLDVKEEPGSRIYPGNAENVNEDVAREADAPIRRGGAGIIGAPVATKADFGFRIPGLDLKRMNYAFTSEATANSYAKDQAEKNPKVLFGVFPCGGTFETTTPTVIQKSFNEDGELTPVKA